MFPMNCHANLVFRNPRIGLKFDSSSLFIHRPPDKLPLPDYLMHAMSNILPPCACDKLIVETESM
jgi:hypothetical protein